MAAVEKTILVMTIAIFGLAIVSQVALAMAPVPPSYCCPLETGVCFYTYDELYAHFTTAHPTEPIEIIWD